MTAMEIQAKLELRLFVAVPRTDDDFARLPCVIDRSLRGQDRVKEATDLLKTPSLVIAENRR